ncbi:deoxyhypusine synthase isoform X2 [Bombina bombina]|uniref:deoxyhypusine synthase isoform X2 n=1 Tax=Bombina bombina TaxID=8345 RepID=UPI00235AEDF2|nr:deoxyhypusine synthase isoform X2 [Bombina bombina]
MFCTSLTQSSAMADMLLDAKEAVLMPSDSLPEGSVQIRGYDFNSGVNYDALLQSFLTTGFQASSYGQAVQEINNMIKAKLSDPGGCTIFLGYTSNLISSGIREIIRYLVEHKMVDIIVTTAGGVEEDIIKCLAPTYLGDFTLKGSDLRPRGINRIGNLLVPNNNYCLFEDWIIPILNQMVEEQDTEGINWTPSKMIARLGKEINNPDSVCYWAQKNDIPIFSPALTDGSLGDMLYFHSYKKPGLKLDIIEDIRKLNGQAVFAKKTGIIILGGGLIKHHIANANLMRNGADYAVYVNTAQEFDGSDSGARPDEAVSWGKIRMEAKPVKHRKSRDNAADTAEDTCAAKSTGK